MATKDKNVRVVSPVGISQYAWLTQPDTQFDPDGHYKTNLLVKTDEAQPLIKQIDDEIANSVKLAQENNKGKKIKTSNPPYMEEVDDEGNETGYTVFKFKTKAKIHAKDGTIIPNKVAIFDSKGKPLVDTNVWSGSEMKVSAELIKYYTAIAGAGVSMRLRAVQITNLVEGGNGNAKGYGFDEVAGGYENTEDTSTTQETANENTQEFQEEADF